MKKNNIISIVCLIALYILISNIVDKSFILPKIPEIFISLKNIVLDSDFIITILSTIYRTLIGVIISFILGIICACLSYRYKTFKELLEPLYVILKTIPNITYIIVALIWLGRSGSIILVASTVIFPIFYNSILTALNNIDINLVKYTSLIDVSYIYKLFHVFLPLVINEILNSLKNCLSLAFKVSIMAEILSQIKTGIGRELYFAKSNFLTSDIFAWTIVIILISALFDYLIDLIVNYSKKHL